jgi:uncharacterized protein YegJ (DUF2314 family)
MTTNGFLRPLTVAVLAIGLAAGGLTVGAMAADDEMGEGESIEVPGADHGEAPPTIEDVGDEEIAPPNGGDEEAADSPAVRETPAVSPGREAAPEPAPAPAKINPAALLGEPDDKKAKPSPMLDARGPDYYDRRAADLLKEDTAASNLLPHPLMMNYPDSFVVVCTAGCRNGTGAAVVGITPKPAALPTPPADVPVISCVGGCASNRTSSYAAVPASPAGEFPVAGTVGEWMTTVAKVTGGEATPEPRPAAAPAAGSGDWMEKINRERAAEAAKATVAPEVKPAAPAAADAKTEDKPATPAVVVTKPEPRPAAPVVVVAKPEPKPATPMVADVKPEPKPAAPAVVVAKAEPKPAAPTVADVKPEPKPATPSVADVKPEARTAAPAIVLTKPEPKPATPTIADVKPAAAPGATTIAALETPKSPANAPAKPAPAVEPAAKSTVTPAPAAVNPSTPDAKSAAPVSAPKPASEAVPVPAPARPAVAMPDPKPAPISTPVAKDEVKVAAVSPPAVEKPVTSPAKESVAPKEKVISVLSEDKEMNAAIGKARGSLATFWKSYDSPAANESDHALKVAISANGNTEHFWLTRIKREGDKYSGLISNQPQSVKTVKMGQRYEFTAEMVSDWTFKRNGKLVGNETMRVLLPRMPEEQAAVYRQMYETP